MIFNNFLHNYFFIYIFFLILIFGIIFSYEDLKYRKIDNYLNFLFLIFSISIFTIITISKKTFINFLIYLIFFIISFGLYYFKIWGAADGKLFLGIVAILLCFNIFFLENFVINLVILYSIYIIFLTFFFKSKRDKIRAIKMIKKKFFEIFLRLEIIYLLYKFIINFTLKFQNFYYEFIIFYFFIIYILLTPLINILRKNYKKLILILSFILLPFVLFIFSLKELIHFVLIVLIITFAYYVSFVLHFDEKKKIVEKKDFIYTPFVIFLIISLLITLILKYNLIYTFVLFF